jgi:xanthine dehydrogenase YagR molybdenum-binding subunit
MRAVDDQVRLGKVLYPAVSAGAAWEIAEANIAARLCDWSPFAVGRVVNLLTARSQAVGGMIMGLSIALHAQPCGIRRSRR